MIYELFSNEEIIVSLEFLANEKQANLKDAFQYLLKAIGLQVEEYNIRKAEIQSHSIHLFTFKALHILGEKTINSGIETNILNNIKTDGDLFWIEEQEDPKKKEIWVFREGRNIKRSQFDSTKFNKNIFE